MVHVPKLPISSCTNPGAIRKINHAGTVPIFRKFPYEQPLHPARIMTLNLTTPQHTNRIERFNTNMNIVIVCMKKTYYESLHLSRPNIKRLEQINAIIEEYHEQEYKLTLRQLYYQLVSRDITPNKVREYTKLSTILVKGRMAGLVDWEAIEDRTRVPKIPYYASSVGGAISDIIQQYRLDRMRDQNVYIEVWVEKDALSGVISRITEKYHVRLMVNRGYSSTTAMHDASERIIESGKTAYILYLGDHDPSGMDMVQDIRSRLIEFNADVTIIPVALTDEQIEKYNPPPNPAKISDPRAIKYIKKYGETSWEVDALPPIVLNNLIEKEIQLLIDHQKYRNLIIQEKIDISKLKEFVKK